MLNLLVVDDDEEEFELLSSAIHTIDESIDIFYADGCGDVLDSVRARKPDIVFMDINMPGRDGLQCLKTIRSTQDFKALPVIMYSTSWNTSNIEQSYLHKASLYVVKQSTYEGMIDALKQILQMDWTIPRSPELNNFVIR